MRARRAGREAAAGVGAVGDVVVGTVVGSSSADATLAAWDGITSNLGAGVPRAGTAIVPMVAIAVTTSKRLARVPLPIPKSPQIPTPPPENAEIPVPYGDGHGFNSTRGRQRAPVTSTGCRRRPI